MYVLYHKIIFRGHSEFTCAELVSVFRNFMLYVIRLINNFLKPTILEAAHSRISLVSF